MGKKAKRERKRYERLIAALDKALGSITKPCPKCGKVVKIPPIDSWVQCACGKEVYR